GGGCAPRQASSAAGVRVVCCAAPPHRDEKGAWGSPATAATGWGAPAGRALARSRRYLMPSLDGEAHEPLPGRAAGAEYDQVHRPFNAHDGNSIFSLHGVMK